MKTLKHLFTALLLMVATVATAHDFEVDGIYYAIISSTNKTVEVTFKGNSSSYYDEYRGNVVIPKNVTYNNETYNITSIGDEAFYGCSALTSVTIGNSVTSIGWGAFEDCTWLRSITIPNSVTSIGISAFSGTAWLNNQPDGVIYAGKVLYKYNGTMPENTNITINEGTLGIADYAFDGCIGLTSITIPNSVTSIGNSAYSGCTGIKEVHISDLAAWCGIDFENYNSNPLYYAHNLYLNGELVTELVIPDSVNEIKGRAFSYCTGLTSVTIGNSVTIIGEGAFRDCSALTSVTIGNSVTSIGWEAFEDCTNLTSVTIPNSVTSIEGGAFSGTAWLNNQPDGVIYAGKVLYKYKGTMPENTNITINEGTLGIADYAFSACHGLTSITIPNSVTSIGHYAFYGCTGLTNITIPNSVTSIGFAAFYGCSGLTSITIPNSITSIGDFA
ncbi:MAG: leucine-rich repeat domain-containing protein, partial [Bacteroidaceae bacterium]|nr:leucine-rich repeat domain-containing protein [Bacteroidaceae bacterium]